MSAKDEADLLHDQALLRRSVCGTSERRHGNYQKRPAIHMPRCVSRLTLTVTATKIERLQTMTTRDVRAEGMPPIKVTAGCNDRSGIDRAFINQFAVLWDELHGAGAWAANPEVVALTFTVEKRNIDAEPLSKEQRT